eukprot:TRINITY_DN4692_c2_g1_i1.p2 TRINITY_DN4692_c2_g1~~TRINITY_DN4692_c2_g1_i1.p2  ORF type:complete len:148 (-),score=6.41 TRINITY_DN4692_c2_g1_i1:541-984(-)
MWKSRRRCHTRTRPEAGGQQKEPDRRSVPHDFRDSRRRRKVRSGVFLRVNVRGKESGSSSARVWRVGRSRRTIRTNAGGRKQSGVHANGDIRSIWAVGQSGVHVNVRGRAQQQAHPLWGGKQSDVRMNVEHSSSGSSRTPSAASTAT